MVSLEDDNAKKFIITLPLLQLLPNEVGWAIFQHDLCACLIWSIYIQPLQLPPTDLEQKDWKRSLAALGYYLY
jgi:hypothetical protein